MADNLFDKPKAKEKDNSASLKVDLTGLGQVERAKEPLSLLSVSSIEASKAIATALQPSVQEIATSSPVSRQREEQTNKPGMLSAINKSDSLKSIYEDGILKLYDDPGKSHFGFKFLESGVANKERLFAGVAGKDKVEDLQGTISLQYRIKF